jgi:hypothetical protein
VRLSYSTGLAVPAAGLRYAMSKDATLTVIVSGFFLSVLIGIPLALAISFWPFFNRTEDFETCSSRKFNPAGIRAVRQNQRII